MKKNLVLFCSIACFIAVSALPGFSIDEKMMKRIEASKKIANPICAMSVLPIEYNHYTDVGPYKGDMDVVSLKPVLPVTINEDWNFVSRTLIHFAYQKDLAPESTTLPIYTGVPASPVAMTEFKLNKGGNQGGLTDMQESMFITPSKPMAGFLWGVGAIFNLPTGDDQLLEVSTNKWGAGPTAAVVRQDGWCTYGFLTNHVWSFADGGEDKDINIPIASKQEEMEDINQTFIQPFFIVTTPTTGTSLSFTSEAKYNWESEEWSVPFSAILSQVVIVGPQILQLKIGANYYYKSAEIDPEGWSVRAGVTMIFLKS